MTDDQGNLVLALMRVRELERELVKRDEQVKWLTVALSELAAGPIMDVSEDQFALMVAEGPLQ